MWRDWRKWHPNTIKANCFWGLRKRDLLQSLPKRCSQIQTWINSGKSSKNGSKKDPQQPPPFVFIITISRVIIIKCILFIEMFLQGRKEKKKKKRTALWITSVFLSLAELLWMKLKVSAMLSGKAQRLLHGSISNSLTGTHTRTDRHTHTQHAEYKMRPWHKTISQTGSVIQKHTDKKEKTGIMWMVGGIVATIHMCL